MTDVAEIVASLMTELIQAQKQSTELSKDIAESQKSDPIMRMLPIPGIRIDTFDLELKFIVDQNEASAAESTADTSTASTTPSSELDSDVEIAKKKAIFSTLSKKAVAATFADAAIKALIAKNKLTDRNVTLLQSKLSGVIAGQTNDDGQLNRSRIQALGKSHLSKTNLKAAADTAKVLESLTAQLENYSRTVLAHLAPTADSSRVNNHSGSNKPRFVVDRNILSKVTPELISTLKMTLSLDEYEWMESESGDTLRIVQ